MTERQRRFCALVAKGVSHRQAAKECGYHADYGKKLMDREEIKQEIDLKKENKGPLSHGPDEVLKLYEKIAFCDLGDYLRFGTREEDGKTVSYVELKESATVDGQLIEEIVISPKGIPKVKVPDKMKALEKLERYYDLLPDTYRRQLEERKLQLADKEEQPMMIVTKIPRPEDE
ncbi:MAG: terminase small subunit [Clostridiales bacterium]|nr:terminase small subunit [Clostridiales bacterium]